MVANKVPKFIINVFEQYGCISLWEEKYGHDWACNLWELQCLKSKQSLTGKYKELRTRICTKRVVISSLVGKTMSDPIVSYREFYEELQKVSIVMCKTFSISSFQR